VKRFAIDPAAKVWQMAVVPLLACTSPDGKVNRSGRYAQAPIRCIVWNDADSKQAIQPALGWQEGVGGASGNHS